jgi:hypothetical protein
MPWPGSRFSPGSALGRPIMGVRGEALQRVNRPFPGRDNGQQQLAVVPSKFRYPILSRTTLWQQQSSSREPIVGSASNLPVNTWLKDGAYLRVPRPAVPDGDLLRAIVDFDPHRYRDINQIIDVWLPLTLATNCTNRSMGRPDLYSSCYRRALSTNWLYRQFDPCRVISQGSSRQSHRL